MTDELKGDDAVRGGGRRSPERPAPAAGEGRPAPGTPRGAGGPGSGDGSKRRKVAAVVVAAALLALLAAGALALFGNDGPGDFFDPDAQEGQAPYKTAEEMQAELDRIVEEGMFNISISGEIEFADGESEGVAYIENVPGNRYHMKVVIALDGTGEVVYESGGIAPGSYIETISLSRDLDAGAYDATATFGAYDTETLDQMGRAAAKVRLVVLN